MKERKHGKVSIGVLRNSGTFADVYEGVLTDSSGANHEVAVKILKKKWIQNEDLLNRLEDEALLLDLLNHPNIIHVFGLARVDDRPAIVMELVRGIDLRELLRHKNLPPNIGFQIAASVCKALDAAFRQVPQNKEKPLQVIHRDIKPSNIMINQKGVVKVLDFGASRFQDEARKGQTLSHQFGSPKYMPSERRLGNRGKHVSDIYSMGIMLIEMLQQSILDDTPPSENNEYQHFLSENIEKIRFQLPNLEWTERAKEMLYRMCAYDKNNRLSARQCVPLMEAFAEQASGPDFSLYLQRYLQDAIAHYKQSYANGPLSDGVYPMGLNHEDTNLTPVNVKTFPQNQRKKEDHHTQGFTALLKNKVFIISGIIAFFMSFLTLSAISLIFYSATEEAPSGAVQQTVEAENKSAEESHMVELKMDKRYFRKIRLMDKNADVMLSAKRTKPENSANLPAGKYQIEALIIGATKKLKTMIEINEALTIRCETNSKDKAICKDQNDNQLLLQK